MPTARLAIRRHALGLALALAVFAAGCAKPAAKPWEAPPPPNDPAFQKAQAECATFAVKQTETVSPQSQASKAAVGIYAKCLTEKGFPPPEPPR